MSTPSFPLKSTLGRSYNADLEDARRTKEAFKRLGYFEMPRYGLTPYPDEALFTAIERFQGDHDLRRDGIMRPDGETAARLGQVLADAARKQSRAASAKNFVEGEWDWPERRPGRARDVSGGPRVYGLGGEVGEGRRNDTGDVLATMRALAWAGFYPSDRASTGRGVPDAELFDAVKGFQGAQGLAVDGWMRPGGETARALDDAIAPKIAAWRNPRNGEGTAPQDTDGVQVAQAQAIPWLLRATPPAIGALGEILRRETRRPRPGESRDEPDAPAGSRRTDIAEPPPPVPPSEPDGEEHGHKEEFPATKLKPIDLSHPIPDELEPGIYIHPVPDEELAHLGQIVESRGNADTQAEIERIRAGFMQAHPDWRHIGGGYDPEKGYRKEYHIPGPGGGEAGGALAGKPRGQRGDGRLGGHRTDLTFISPDKKRIVHIQTVDVDRNGKVAQHELDAAERIRRLEYSKDTETYVILFPKGAQLNKIFGQRHLR